MSGQKLPSLLSLVNVKQLIAMFDLLPGVLFWIKDEHHRFVYANQSFVVHQGADNVEQIVGKTDFDFSSKHLAKQYTRDDEKILQGQSVTERLEMNTTRTGEIAWFVTSKRPLTNEQDEIIGSFGVTRHIQKQAKAMTAIDEVSTPVNFIRDNYHRRFTIDELAEVAHLSVSALERRFKKYLAKTPKQFVNEIRLENARRLLVESAIPISQVGDQVGFTDHSYFSKQFKLFFGELPSAFRENHRKNSS